MEKVKFIKLNSASVTADNSADVEKKYEITAKVNINENKVNSIDGGRVIKDGVDVASFSKWDNGRSNKEFKGVSDEEECVILMEINSFIRNVYEKVETEPIQV